MALLRGLIAPSRAQLEPAGKAAIAARDGISLLMPRSMALMDELTLTVGASVPGTKIHSDSTDDRSKTEVDPRAESPPIQPVTTPDNLQKRRNSSEKKRRILILDGRFECTNNSLSEPN